jgi:hypothetical protein
MIHFVDELHLEAEYWIKFYTDMFPNMGNHTTSIVECVINSA